MTKQEKLLKALRAGKELTAAQIQSIGYANPSAAVYNLRSRKMISVVGTTHSLKNGDVVTKYALVTPTRAQQRQGFTV